MTLAPIASLWGGTSRPSPAFGIIALTIVLTIAFAVQTKGVWISKDNLASVLQVTATLGIMALGEALVITVREIDISVGSTFGIGALVYLGAAQFISPWAAVAGAILAGSAIGAINGLLVTRLKVNALVATLGTLFIFRGLCYALTEGFSFSAGDELTGSWAYAIFGGGEIFGIKNSLIWLLLIAAILHMIVFTTRSGNWLLAVGGDEPSALSRGVRTDAVKLVAFVAAGTLAALAGVLEASKIGFADGSFGRLQELQAIAACVIGGCALTGGRCSIVGVVFATFMLMGIQSVLVLNSVQPQWFMIFLGTMVIIAMVSDKAIRKWILRK
jgi:ribose transport system permease protein